jgi:ABC-type nitrate/sulfonate/bicarbonate transport system substrate-binding protein
MTKGKVKRVVAAVMAADKNWAANNGKAVKAFRKSLQQAMTWINKNPAKARAVLGAWLKLPRKTVKASPASAYSVTVTAGEFKVLLDLSKAVGTLPPNAPSAKSLLIPGADRKP